jgi:uncharacterized membrane protein/predicted DsbA family dithiol-disulfide isomerase
MQEKARQQGLLKRRGDSALLGVVLLMSLVGLGLSLYLSVLHWQVNNEPGHVSFCAMNEAVNCDTVALSRYSSFLGIPISTWGIFFYMLVMVLSVWGLRLKESLFPWGLLGWLGALAVWFSIFLGLIAELCICSFCIMCGCLYLINLAVAGLSVFGQKRAGVPVASSMALLFLVAALAVGVFFAILPEGQAHEIALLVFAFVLLVGSVVFALRGQWNGVKILWAGLTRDVAMLFQRPWVGMGLSLVGAAAVAGAYMLTDWAYVDTVIAGGLEGLSTGRTSEGRNWIGAANPDLEIIEFSDYECPYCGKAHQIVRELVRERKDWLRLVHLHMPLDVSCNRALNQPFHKNSCACARAALCADRQNRFWEMNDILFMRRGGLDGNGLAMVAGKIGLNLVQFRSCMQSVEVEQALQSELEESRRLGIKPATPVFVVGGEVVMGFKEKRWWVEIIDRLRRRVKEAGQDSSGDAKTKNMSGGSHEREEGLGGGRQ